jgi:hypothetical protein
VVALARQLSCGVEHVRELTYVGMPTHDLAIPPSAPIPRLGPVDPQEVRHREFAGASGNNS